MLLGLIFRGVAFEFRFKADERHRPWDRAFVLGSVCATFFQGVALGAHRGIPVVGRVYQGGPWDWISPSRCSPARAWWPPMRCWAAPG